MNIKTFPGKHAPSKVFEKKLYDNILDFMGPVRGRCADIGERNVKMEYIKSVLGVSVDQITAHDFNDCVFSGDYDYVFCFEVIEHLQDPLRFMSEVMKLGDVIYLTTPNRPRFLWSPHHYNELSPTRIHKWIFEPLGLSVIRRKRLYVPHKWWFYFTGVRPFLRLFLNTKWIYELKKCV